MLERVRNQFIGRRTRFANSIRGYAAPRLRGFRGC
ncbi:hypothetical protein ABH973_003773 [Bradyrhizobium ottawaense]